MKRHIISLVNYESSDDEVEDMIQGLLPPLKKRKLPSLSSSLVALTPIDNPALHQGRLRTTPHVEGQFAAHVYISIKISRHLALHKLIDSTVKDAMKIEPALCTMWSGDSIHCIELHISLSRLIALRAHQREDLKKAVKALSKKQRPFALSFVSFSELINTEKTRTFLTIQVGAGHSDLKALSDGLTPALKAIRQNEFYTSPRFHASIAWALLSRSTSEKLVVPPDADIDLPSVSDRKRSISPSMESDLAAAVSSIDFPTVPHLPKVLVPTLNERYSSTLASAHVGTVNIEAITVKVGKEITSWQFTGI